MNNMRFWGILISTVTLLTLAACGSSSSSSDGGGSGTTYVSWPGNSNGSVVQDANGNGYRFDDSDGCMFGTSSNVGPQGFCLTSGGSGYLHYGPTNCSNPGNNSLCDTASFAVVLTNDPGGAGCIAVLTAGDSSSVTALSLAVTNTGNGFNIQSGKTAAAFTVYWNGLVPICGGSNPFEGSYTLDVTPPSLGSGSGCELDTLTAGTYTIDSGGVIDDDKGESSGTIKSDGTGSFGVTTVDPIQGGSSVTTISIASATKNASGKWVLSGTDFPFCVGFNANPWTLTQN